MKILFIGGTGTISMAITRLLAQQGHELYLLNVPLLPRIMTEFAHEKTGIDIHPGATVGEYFFIDRERYDQMVLQDELLEHAEYVSNGYGTPRFFVEQKLSEGMNVVLDIEIQGARQVREKMPEAVLVFVIPPSMEELRRRLVGRGTDSPEAIEGRLLRAREEYAEADFYDYLIVNDDADEAAADFSAIVRAEHLRAQDRLYLLK